MSAIKEYLSMMAKICEGTNQADFRKTVFEDARDVKVVPCSEVFTKEEIARIKRNIRPKKKQCYKNATLLADMFGCEYCEGYMLHVFPVEHAFNKVGDKYVDITVEFALKEDVKKIEYTVIGTYTKEEVKGVCLRTSMYGNVYNEKYIERFS